MRMWLYVLLKAPNATLSSELRNFKMELLRVFLSEPARLRAESLI